MSKTVAIIFLCATLVTGGIVDPVFRCGGLGIPMQSRVSDCEGRCQLQPGKTYHFEQDFLISGSASSITFNFDICWYAGFCTTLVDVVIPVDHVQPGFVYTLKWDVVPMDHWAGQSVEFKSMITEGDYATSQWVSTLLVAWILGHTASISVASIKVAE